MSDPRRRFGGRYELLGPLSTGPGGAVWCGRDLLGGAGCAVRLLEPGLAADPAGGGELLGVLGRVGRLAHPNIVAVDDVVSGEGCTALVMPLVSGESLAARLSRLGALPAAEAAALVAQLCGALAAAHAAGLAHGRVKPSNILLEPGADALLTVKLTDFGMAALGAGVSVTPRSAASAVSAAVYRAPELEFAMPPTPQADVYASGVVLYEALAGRAPFAGTRALDITQQHRQAAPPRPADLPDALWSLLSACLEKDPGRRPTAGLLADLLRALVPDPLPVAPPVLPGAAAMVPAAAHLPLFDPALTDTASVDPAASDRALSDPAPSDPAPSAPGQAPEPTVVISPHAARRTRVRARQAELAVTIGVALLVGAVTFAVGGRRPGAPEAGSRVIPVGSGASSGAAPTATATGGASGAASTAASPGSSPAAAPTFPAPATGSPSEQAATSTPPGIPAGPAGSQSTTSPPTATGQPGTGGLGVADPIGYLEGLRTQIQALVAQGRATIDPIAAGDLQNLVLDLENSVVAYQQNGGAAHVQEIRDKISGFDARLTSLVGQGRLSQPAADQLATYLQRLAPA